MLQPCKNTLNLIRITYDGKELTAMLEAWDRYPTYKTDCGLERVKKETKRKQFAERILNL